MIGVIDLMGGVAVRAAGGRRDEYRPIQSRLCESADPRRVGAAFRERYGISRLYVADLDAILGRPSNAKVLAGLAADGFRLAVDAGLRTAEDADWLMDVGTEVVVAGLETLSRPAELARVVERIGRDRIAFSLDLAGGVPLAQPADWDEERWSVESPLRIARRAVEAGVETLIVLDLNAVGAAGGPATADICRRLRGALPRVRVWTGGGVRNEADIAALIEAGAEAVLVASALHDEALPGA